MLDKVKISLSGTPFAGEHRAKDIVIKELERIPGALYYLEIQSTDGKSYQIELPDDAESIPIDGTMIPKEGFLQAMLLYKTAAGDVIAKSETSRFKIQPALMASNETLPDYQTVKTLADEVLSVPEQVEKYIGTVEDVRAAGEAAQTAATRAEQAADGSVPEGAVSGVKLNNAVTNLLDLSKCTPQGIVPNGSGVIYDDPDFILTDYIPCISGGSYYCPAGNRRRGNWYDKDKKFIKYVPYSSYPMPGTITAPEGAAFLRISYGVTPYEGVAGWDSEHSMIVYGGTGYPTEYIPYGTDVDWLYTIPKDKSVTSKKLNNSAVTTEHIANKAVTLNKMADVQENLLKLSDCIPGKLSAVNGTIDEGIKDYFTSAFITLSEGQPFTCPEGEDRCICFYDSEKQFLSSDAYVNEMPEGAAFLRVSYKTSGFDVWNPMLCVGADYPDKYIKPGINLPWLEHNPLQGKKLAILGDSICALHKSYITAVGYQNNMDFDRQTHNQSVWGSPIARHNIANEPASYLERFSLLRDTTDYLVIHGGVNDARMNIPIGTLTAWDDFTGSLNEYTFIGALESLFRKAQKKYPAAKIVFVLNYKLLHLPAMESYMDAALRVCGKYSIPVLDLYHSGVLNIGIPEMKAKYWSDDIHLNEWGHLALVPVAENFLKGLTSSTSFGDPENAVKRLAYEKKSADVRFSPSILDSLQGVLPMPLSDIADNTPLTGIRLYGNTTETLVSGTKGPNNKSVFQDISQTINLTCGEQSQTIILPQPMYRINNDICDSLTHTGTLTSCIKKLILKGTEVWKHYKNNGNYVCFYLQDSTLKAKLNSGTGLCNIVDWYANSASLATRSGVCTTSTDNIIFFNLPCADIGNDPNKSKDAQVADFVAWLAAQYTAGTPVIVYYQLATPITTQAAGFSLPIPTYPVTTISTTDTVPARISVDYYRDTKSYIDSKFAQLSAAIISMGGTMNV